MFDRGLRTSFDEDAELYHRARPTYPGELLNSLAELTELGPNCRIAEIGPGTGQATAALLVYGAQVVAVELGAGLAEVLRRRLGSAGIDIVVSAFEDWRLPDQPFDIVACFTAWHWLDEAVRTPKAAAALRPGGALATVRTLHVADGSQNFFVRAQDCYQRWDPTSTPGFRLKRSPEVPPERDEVDHCDSFLPAIRRRFHQDVTYTSAGYLDLLNTYSGHRALPAQSRANLLACLARLIDEEHGGTITKRYLYELRVARRR